MGALALLLPLITDVLKRVLPDPGQAADAQLKLATMVQNGELAQLAADSQIAQGQLAVNVAEASRAGRAWLTWREAFGWVCVIAVGFKLVGGPLLVMACDWLGHPVKLPELDTSELWPVLWGMLGLGAMKTAEVIKGTK